MGVFIAEVNKIDTSLDAMPCLRLEDAEAESQKPCDMYPQCLCMGKKARAREREILETSIIRKKADETWKQRGLSHNVAVY